MIQFIPSNLNLDELLQRSPPAFKYHRDNFIHLINLITEVPAKNKNTYDKSGFVRLNAALLKSRIYNYRKHLDWLLSNGVFESHEKYCPGERSKGYRFTEKYCTPVTSVLLQKYTLKKSIKKRGKYDRCMVAKYWYLHHFLDERLAVDFEEAKKYLEFQFWQDQKQDYRKSTIRLNRQLVNLITLSHGEHYFRVDTTAGRLHTLVTRVSKGLRQFVSFEGHELYSVDIKCSQPWLVTVLLNPNFYDRASAESDRFTIYNFTYGELQTLPLDAIHAEVRRLHGCFTEYIEMFDGDFYEKMIPHLQSSGYPVKDRDGVKEIMYAVLFSSNKFIGQKKALPKRVFKQLFPEVYHILSLFKKESVRSLPILLQRMEAALVLDRAAREFTRGQPNLPLYTIHDSLVTVRQGAEKAAECIKEQAMISFGSAPHVEIEGWSTPKKTDSLQTCVTKQTN